MRRQREIAYNARMIERREVFENPRLKPGHERVFLRDSGLAFEMRLAGTGEASAPDSYNARMIERRETSRNPRLKPGA